MNQFEAPYQQKQSMKCPKCEFTSLIRKPDGEISCPNCGYLAFKGVVKQYNEPSSHVNPKE